MKSFRRAVRLLLGATIGLVVIGVIVRATDSGMGCPDWPLCYGQVIPPTTDSGDVVAYKAWLEWIHRTIAAVSDDLERFRFNSAVARIRELTNALADLDRKAAGGDAGADKDE